MNINDAFPSQWLKAGDLKGRNVTVTIEQVVTEEIGGDVKPVMHFTGKDRGLVLNKTNGLTIAEAYGPETSAWRGKPIILYPTKTQYQAKMVDCIRVRIPDEPKPAPAPLPEPEPSHQDLDDSEIPF